MVRFGACLGVLIAGSAVSFGQWTASEIVAPGFDAARVQGANNNTSAGTAYSFLPNEGYVGHAMIWNRDGTVLNDLNPTTALNSSIWGSNGNDQVGTVELENGENGAALWHGSAASFTFLGRHDWSTMALACSPFGQVGYGMSDISTNMEIHAVFWQGTSQSMVDLNPVGSVQSVAYGVGPGYQLGMAFGDFGAAAGHAFLWHGTAESAIVMDAVGFSNCELRGGSEHYQVGSGHLGSASHALLWSGSAESAIDIHPAGYFASGASAISDSEVYVAGVVSSATDYMNHAFLWNRQTGESYDLQSLTTDFPFAISYSEVTGVADNGDVVGFVYESNNARHAVRWTHVVPEPTSMIVLSFGAVTLLRRRPKGRV